MGGNAVQRLCVVGAGTMGHQIAMLGALAGCGTAVVDVSAEALEKARSSNHAHMARWVKRGRLSEGDAEQALGRIRRTTSIEEGARDADFVIEAVVERLAEKRQVFATLDRIAPPHAILATNSSTIRSSLLADATGRADRVCNMHFFNPPLVMELVEVVMHPRTSEATAEEAMALARRMRRTPILLRREISGFVVNRILAAIMDESMRLYEAGIASFEDIDLAVKKGLRHPMGPFELMDHNGIDVAYNVRMQRFEESGDPAQRPARSIVERYERGDYGRKTGKGWYVYPPVPSS
ncbi:MAG TPA: 3-hydroxyacyl-CoA dehydrogenase family protein [bacterium]|nr:3-hydroxyacyl-CoA dehydrogenase family protein [bacterium]